MFIRALKRKRDESDSDFTRKMKGNKKQYKFNCSVESHLEEIAVAKTLLDAKNSAEGLCLMKEQNKLIKIVDQHGWDTVNRYVSNPLTEDEADEKRLREAVKDAERARDKMKSNKIAKSCRSARARAFASTATPMTSCQGASPSAYVQNQPQSLVVPADRSLKTSRCFCCGRACHLTMTSCQGASPSAYVQNQPQSLVVPADRSLKTSRCFCCGRACHFQRDCVAQSCC